MVHPENGCGFHGKKALFVSEVGVVQSKRGSGLFEPGASKSSQSAARKPMKQLLRYGLARIEDPFLNLINV